MSSRVHDESSTPLETGQSAYLVVGRDAPGVGSALEALASIHWDYMDRFASQLIARGPMLSPDGEEHTGSVHVVAAASAADAQRFADEEPYHQARLYADVTVTRFESLLTETMWQRAPADPPAFSTFVLATWPAQPCSPNQSEHLRTAAASDKAWVFLGLLLSNDGHCSGLAAAADLQMDAAEHAARTLLQPIGLHPVTIERHRWQRGGRSDQGHPRREEATPAPH